MPVPGAEEQEIVEGVTQDREQFADPAAVAPQGGGRKVEHAVAYLPEEQPRADAVVDADYLGTGVDSDKPGRTTSPDSSPVTAEPSHA